MGADTQDAGTNVVPLRSEADLIRHRAQLTKARRYQLIADAFRAQAELERCISFEYSGKELNRGAF